jgi:peptidoglycan hydrolase-like protein with peptidoglycan-binding domain
MRVLTSRVLPKESRAVKADRTAMSGSLEAGNALNLGDQGKPVAALQRALKSAGLYEGPINGDFDVATEAAVKALQTARGLEASGIVGGKTLKALKSTQRFVKDGFEEAARAGQRGSDIARAERMLAKLGYNPGKADGVFDAATQKAVERFRKADPKLNEKSSAISEKVYDRLAAASKAYEHAPIRRRDIGKKGELEAHARLDAATKKAAGKGDGVGLGAKGRAVENIEKHLEAAGYDLGKANDSFGARTEAATKAFQKAVGLEQTGQVDAKTWAKLEGKLFAASSSTSPSQRLGERSGAVKATEQRLKFLGFNPGKIDGEFTRGTQKAVEKFQRKHKLDVSGAVGGRTGRVLLKKVKAKKLAANTKKVTAYVNGVPRTIRVTSVGGGEWLRADAAKALKKMYAAAKRAGITLSSTSGFRTMAEQKVLWDRFGRDPVRVAPPGFSNHQNGIAMDIGGIGGRGTAADRWLMANCHRFGFKNYAPEFWHYDYVR